VKQTAVVILMTLALWGSTAAAQTTSASSQETQASPSKFHSPDDGWFDVSVGGVWNDFERFHNERSIPTGGLAWARP